MKILKVAGASGVSDIRVGDSLDSLAELVTAEKAIIITDTNVRRLYGKRFPDWDVIVNQVSANGRCLRFEDAFGQMLRNHCVGTPTSSSGAPR